MKKNLLSAAVKGALGLTAAAIMIPAMPVFAQEDAALVEEVVVTGSRIKRTNFDQSAQNVSIDREDIDAIGALTVADVLRTSPLNSMGSFSERSGSSAQSNATIDLRGLGSSRTLVMLNGRRMVGSPNLGASAININMIPMAAIERVDIMADGGSAVYGSDAVAGVVNMVMRENFEGLEFKVTSADRSRDDGREEGFALITGMSGERGNITVAAEWNRRDPIFDKDRDYTAPWAKDLNGDGEIEAYDETDGASIYGKSIWLFDPTTGFNQILAANGCAAGNGFLGEVSADSDWGAPSNLNKHSYCMYNYGDVSANKAELDKVNTYVNASYQLTDSMEFFSTLLFSRVESFGRFAPPAATWGNWQDPSDNMPADYADVPFDIDALLASGEISENYNLTGYYRWTNIGTRDNLVTDTQYDIVAGFRGDINDNVSYETYLQKSYYDVKEYGYYYLSYPGLDYVLARGIDPFSEEGAAAMRHTATQDNYTDMTKAYGHVQFDAFELPSGTVTMLAGAEAFSVDYGNKYDSHSEAGLVGGSAGNSSSGDRDVTAVFAEAIIPVVEGVEVNAAIRYDDYSDFGSAVSPSLSATWNVMDALTLRARVSEGFRAPGLDQLYGPETFSAERAVDYVACEQSAIAAGEAYDPSDCGSPKQKDTYYASNEDLEAEESSTFSIGANYEINDNWNVDLGYWSVEVDNVITQPSTQSVLYAEAAGIEMTEADGVYVNRAGGFAEVYSTYKNSGTLSVTGLDLKVSGLIETDFGQFTADTLVSHTLTYEQMPFYNGKQQETVGFNLQPDLRAQLALGWNYDNHAVNLIVDYVGEHSEGDFIEPVGTDGFRLATQSEQLDSWTTLNLSYSYDFQSFGKIKIGARNLTDEDPVLDRGGKYPGEHADLYDATGRVVYGEYTVAF
ncbi:TonB-dependent receptor plug domain-containing protein [Microbulbifer sp. TRSA005]|uniref:TonB-dependent receptor plug domain-containing protein n=1 Tax=unclassified Microbulbifer TaxID=2619833 RepID=UPI0040394387